MTHVWLYMKITRQPWKVTYLNLLRVKTSGWAWMGLISRAGNVSWISISNWSCDPKGRSCSVSTLHWAHTCSKMVFVPKKAEFPKKSILSSKHFCFSKSISACQFRITWYWNFYPFFTRTDFCLGLSLWKLGERKSQLKKDFKISDQLTCCWYKSERW